MFKKIKEALKKKININNTSTLKSAVIYNSPELFIVLFSYTEKHYTELLDFLSNPHGKIILKNITISKEHEESEDDYTKKNIDLIDEKHYALLVADRIELLSIYDANSMSNIFVQDLTNMIYQSRTSSDFKPLIDMVVLDLYKFKYKNIKPEYDEPVKIVDNDKYYTHPNIELIMQRLPEVYKATDLYKYFTLKEYMANSNKPYNRIRPYVLVEQLDRANKENDKNNTIYKNNARLYKCIRLSFYDKFIKNGSLEDYDDLMLPIYLREDDDEEALNGDLPIEQLDVLFQQNYDRFTMPTAEYTHSYEDIDEQLSSDVPVDREDVEEES